MERAMMTRLTDREAAERIRAGGAEGEAAFQQLYERYSSEILAFARRILGERGLAEDVVQECFVRLYQSIDRYQSERPLRPYLFKIAHHIALKTARSAKKMATAAGAGEGQESAGPGVPERASGQELQEIVGEALQGLAPEYRSLLTLRHMSGLKLRELAELLGCTERTIRNRLTTAAVLFERELVRRGLGKEEQE